MTSNAAPQKAKTSGADEKRAHLIKLPEAAAITGLPLSLLRKSFMREEKRPPNVPPPPPHKRIGRAIYIRTDQLRAWVDNLESPDKGKRRRK